MQDGTSREEFEGEARGLQTALEWAQREGADTHRHELLALVVSAMAIESPGKLYDALGEVLEKVVGWRADLQRRLGLMPDASAVSGPLFSREPCDCNPLLDHLPCVHDMPAPPKVIA